MAGVLDLVKQMARRAMPGYFGRTEELSKIAEQSALIAKQQAVIHILSATLDIAVSSPRYTAGESIGFNGQLSRKRIFEEILGAIRFVAVVETGTWVGETTGYLASTSHVPVFSCELHPVFHSLARQRLVDLPGVTVRLSDSRRFLSDLANEGAIVAGPVLFYLDAHWEADLPLREEIALITKNWPQFVIMIDDFQVPGDAGYGYDDYGPEKALTIEYLTEALETKSVQAYFPSAPSSEETGYRRGSVILASTNYASVLDALSSLRKA